MTKGIAVIGAAFGDEGKGLMTDYLAATEPTTVVIRFNGGAQAGHTVVSPLGQRHVFHHLGSGSFAGAPTYLSEHFILNPVLFAREWRDFAKFAETLQSSPTVMADPSCCFTLLSDMMLNQWAEESRGVARHGSCGVGIGETVERMEKFTPTKYGINPTIYDHDWSSMELRATILNVNREWVPVRAAALGIELTAERLAYLDDKDVIERWISDFMTMRKTIKPVQVRDISHLFDTYIFEGAQGLALDGRLNSPYFPHVTRSRTGRTNIIGLAQKLELTRLDFTYMTRSYLTRHGVGKLPYEMDRLPYDAIKDETNVPHDFQGTLRFAYLNCDLLAACIAEDIAAHENTIPGTSRIAMTCMDQLNAIAHYYSMNEERKCRYNDLPDRVEEGTGLPVEYLSFGPSRLNVVPGSEYRGKDAIAKRKLAFN